MSFITIPITIEGNSFRNTAVGNDSLSVNQGGVGQGGSNSAFGFNSLMSNTTGNFNTAVGAIALDVNTTGSGNTAVGRGSLGSSVSGDFNTAQGNLALSTNISGSYNSAFGHGSLQNATGGFNTAIGRNAGGQITTGQNNTILGAYNGNQGGLDIRTLNDYVVLSDGNGNPRLYIDGAGLVTAPGGFAGVGGGITLNNQTGAYTVVASDAGKAINCTANTFTVSLTAAATLGSGFACFIWNTGTGVITIDPNGAETIDGRTTLALRQGEGTQIVCDGTNWLTGSKKTMRGYAENISSTTARPIASGSGAISIGEDSSAAGTYAVAIGNATSSSGSFNVAIGYNSTASGSTSVAVGSNCSSGSSSIALGSSSSANNTGKVAISEGNFSATGDAQYGLHPSQKCLTTNNTPTDLTQTGAAPSSLNQINIPNNSAYAFSGLVVARQQASGGTQSAAWQVSGLIRREASAATTTIVASTVTTISNAPGWTLALTADTVRGALKITATGATATNIRWVASIETSEVSYP